MENSNTELQKIQDLSNRALKRSEFAKKYGALMVFAVLLIINFCITKNFVSSTTVWNLIIHSTTVMCVAMGMTFVIAVAGIDISVGATMALCATVVAMMAEAGVPFLGCLIIGLLLGAGIGSFIGVLTVKFKIQPMVLTLAMMIILRSVARMVSNAKTVQVLDETFLAISGTSFGGIPIQLIYVVAFAVVFFIIAERTVFGKSVEAIGNNATAAKLSGIRSDRIVIGVYLLLGALTALAGVMAVSRTQNCNPSSVGSGMEMQAIAAVVIGGTSMAGGKPRILGTVVGCFIISIITMTVNMNGIDTAWSMLLEAAIIILAVYIQSDKGAKSRKIKAAKTTAAKGA
ncbi:MAG: ABC transporter permease [Christensenella sp.]|uniref:ABC transporter permease n=1 Tax=Christensenella sp. TaxID=1935934 RepID=UPI002B20DD74|nr:ABC transporter permease [Christensenella sp.]MEA5004137.1 ABC transporter permease [Christensenella sp.]